MANVYKGTLGLIGNTPLVEVANIEKNLDLKRRSSSSWEGRGQAQLPGRILTDGESDQAC